MKGLTPQREKFAQAVAAGKSQAEAYRLAYPKSEKWKPETIHQAASRLMADSNVCARVAELRAEIAKAAQVEVVQVVKELAAVTFSDVRSLFDVNGNLLPIHALPDSVAAAVSSVKVVTKRIPGTDPVEVEHVAEIKLWDKNSAADKLMRHLGGYEKDNKQGADALVEAVTKITRRVIDPAGGSDD